MEPEEQPGANARMRRTVRDHNVYRWAGDLIAELCEIRVQGERAARGQQPACRQPRIKTDNNFPTAGSPRKVQLGRGFPLLHLAESP